MSIQSKLSITFILLLVFGVTAISSYSILSIRGYLMVQSEEDMSADARQILLTFQIAGHSEEDMLDILHESGRESRYDVSIFDRYGSLTATTLTPDETDTHTIAAGLSTLDRLLAGGGGEIEVINRKEFDRIYVYGLAAVTETELYFIEISRLKSEIFKPIRTIRWIIYSGMIISIAIILFVSFIFSQYLARPILQITEASRKIAEGDTEHKIHLNRNDEFGKLAESLNRMADRLRSDNEQLIRASENQKQFYADITHEIRNPLHTILGTLEMMQMPNLSEQERKKYINSAHNQAERINRLFKDLMTLQRTGPDDRFIRKTTFDISRLTSKIESVYQPLLAGKPVKLITNVPAVSVHADPDKIEQVLDNLLLNAIKYTPEGTIILQAKPENGSLRVCVIDTGTGIGEEHLPYLFDRFYRADDARSRDSGGTGLGLAVVKSIIEAHQSEISVKSTVGKGSTFCFNLPLVSIKSAE